MAKLSNIFATLSTDTAALSQSVLNDIPEFRALDKCHIINHYSD